MLARMGQTENTPQNLLHINLACLIGKGRKDTGGKYVSFKMEFDR